MNDNYEILRSEIPLLAIEDGVIMANMELAINGTNYEIAWKYNRKGLLHQIGSYDLTHFARSVEGFGDVSDLTREEREKLLSANGLSQKLIDEEFSKRLRDYRVIKL